MKKSIAILAITSLALAGLAQIHGSGATSLGVYCNATNSNYSTTVGYGSGYDAAFDVRTTLLGGASGRFSRNLLRCTGLGYGALDGASNCTDVVAIGDKVGAGWRNRTGWVQIGDAFAHTNGFFSVKDFPHGAKIGPLQLNLFGETGSGVKEHYLDGSLHLTNPTTAAGGGSLIADGRISAPECEIGTVTAQYIHFNAGIGGELDISVDENRRLCVTTNGVLAGYLTITPPAAGNQ